MPTESEKLARLDSFLLQNPLIKNAHASTGLPPWAIATGLLLTIALAYSFAFDINYIQLIAVVGPAFATLRTLEGRDSAEHIRWLKYWAVFGFVYVLDIIFNVSLGKLGHAIRLSVLLWLLLPQTAGASIVYDHVIAPLFRSNKDSLDHALNSVQSKVGQGLQEVRQLAVGVAVNGSKSMSQS